MTTAEIILGLLALVMGGGNIWNWLSNRGKQKVDLIALGQTISGEIIKALKTERQELIDKVGELEERIGELVSHIEALESSMRERGVPVPPRPSRAKPVK